MSSSEVTTAQSSYDRLCLTAVPADTFMIDPSVFSSSSPVSGTPWHPADAWSVSKREECGARAPGCWTTSQLELQVAWGGADGAEDVSPELGDRPGRAGEGVGRVFLVRV